MNSLILLSVILLVFIRFIAKSKINKKEEIVIISSLLILVFLIIRFVFLG